MRPLRHARDLHRKALRHLARHLRRGEAEDLHQFRVRLKQLKALLSATRQPGTAWQPYRGLYRLSSPVRDADLAGAPPRETPEQRALQRAALRFIETQARLPRCTVEELKPLRRPDIGACALRDLVEIRKRLARIPPVRDWHDLRKQCKRVIHNGRYAGWAKRECGGGTGRAFFALLTETAKDIGIWHDQFVLGGRNATRKSAAPVRAAMRRLKALLQPGCCPCGNSENGRSLHLVL